jgi:carboxylate-amine ligase
MAGDFTFGIEEEYFLVDARTKRAVRSMPETFFKAAEAATDGRISREFLQAQIEVITSPHARMADARAELKHLRQAISAVAAEHGLAILAVMRRMLPYVPLLFALSTSSPFWQSRHTGLKGYRLAGHDEQPRSGIPELFRTKAEFDAYVAALVRAGVIADSSFVWWALRPSLRHPTLELRAPDCCTLVEDSIAIAALYRTIARHLFVDRARNADIDAVGRAIVVENKWRAQRYGVHGTFIGPTHCRGGRAAGRRMPQAGDRRERSRRRGARLHRRCATLRRHRCRGNIRRCSARDIRGAQKGCLARRCAARGARLDRGRDAAMIARRAAPI